MTDLFSITIEQRDRRIAELETERDELRLTLANVLGYFRSTRTGNSFYQMGVRKQLRQQIKRKAA